MGAFVGQIPAVVFNDPASHTRPGASWKTPLANLLTYDRPGLMEHWTMDSLQVHGFALAVLAEEQPATEPPEAVCTLRLLIGGDCVWEQQVQVKMTLLNPATHWWGANVVFRENMVNPIEIPHGRTVEAEMVFTFAAKGEVWARDGGIGYQLGEIAAGGASVSTPTAPSIYSYVSEALTGQRTL